MHVMNVMACVGGVIECFQRRVGAEWLRFGMCLCLCLCLWLWLLLLMKRVVVVVVVVVSSGVERSGSLKAFDS